MFKEIEPLITELFNIFQIGYDIISQKKIIDVELIK